MHLNDDRLVGLIMTCNYCHPLAFAKALGELYCRHSRKKIGRFTAT